jgi:beta-lactamase class A
MRLALLFLFFAVSVRAQTDLQQEVYRIAADAHGKVAVSCSLPHSTLNCDLDAHTHPPMQSVFKLPLAVCALHLVEQGRFPLDQPVHFMLGDRILPDAESALQDKYPEANIDVPLQELLRLSTSLSDPVAADILVQVVGGSAVLNSYMASLGLPGFHLEASEHALARDPNAQYRNWMEPAAAVQLLHRLSDGSLLNPEHTQLLLTWMRDTPTGQHKLKANLPPRAIVMHQTGQSPFPFNGVTPVTNDIGLITLPDGRRLAVAVFITDSDADGPTRNGVIARIAKAAYEDALLSN